MVKCRGRDCILPRFHNQGSAGGGANGHHSGHRSHRRKNGEEEPNDDELRMFSVSNWVYRAI